MTRKDYVALARAFALSRPYRYFPGHGTHMRRTWENALIAVMVELSKDNPRFDSEQFVRAAHQGDPGFDNLERVEFNKRRRAYEDQNRLQPETHP